MVSASSVSTPLEVPTRVTLTVPEDVKDMFGWLLRHDARFSGNYAAVAAELLRRGAHAMYEESIQQAEPLDDDVLEALGKAQADAMGAVTSGDEL